MKDEYESPLRDDWGGGAEPAPGTRFGGRRQLLSALRALPYQQQVELVRPRGPNPKGSTPVQFSGDGGFWRLFDLLPEEVRQQVMAQAAARADEVSVWEILTGAPSEIPGVFEDYQDGLANLLMSGHAFFAGLVTGAESQLGAAQVARLSERLVGSAGLAALFPVPFGAGVATGIAEDLADLVVEIAELVSDPGAVLGAARDLALILVSEDGALVAEELGHAIGVDSASTLLDVVELADVALAFELGRLAAPWILAPLLFFCGLGLGRIAARLIPRLLDLVERVPGARRLRRLVEQRRRSSRSTSQSSSETTDGDRSYDHEPERATRDDQLEGGESIRTTDLDTAANMAVSGESPEALLRELRSAGVRHSPEDIIRIARRDDGSIVFLETGSGRAGLAHVIQEHAGEFGAQGISVDQLPDAIMAAVLRGRPVGMQGTRPILEFEFNGTTHQMAVTVGDNGFIVGANPRSRPVSGD